MNKIGKWFKLFNENCPNEFNNYINSRYYN